VRVGRCNERKRSVRDAAPAVSFGLDVGLLERLLALAVDRRQGDHDEENLSLLKTPKAKEILEFLRHSEF
jgi:hypothetical protein